MIGKSITLESNSRNLQAQKKNVLVQFNSLKNNESTNEETPQKLTIQKTHHQRNINDNEDLRFQARVKCQNAYCNQYPKLERNSKHKRPNLTNVAQIM